MEGISGCAVILRNFGIHWAMPAQVRTLSTAPIVVSSGKGTGNTNQYTQHKRQVFLARGLRDKRENHVTSGIGLVSRSRVSPVYNQEREN